MKGKSIHESVCLRRAVAEAGLHHAFSPLVVVYIRSACHLEDLLIMIVLTHIGLVSAVKIAIVLRCHISAAAPVLIADSEIINGPCVLIDHFPLSVSAIGDTPSKVIYSTHSDISLHRAASDIAVDVCFTAQLIGTARKIHVYRNCCPLRLRPSAY